MGTYASKTDVPESRSRDHIEKALERYGATAFAYAKDANRAAVRFDLSGRRVQFLVRLPEASDPDIARTPAGRARTSAQVKEALAQATRQRWRALHLIITAKLEAIESGLVTLEQELGMFVLLPDGSTVADHVAPAINQAYLTGSFDPMLQIGAGPSA